ncbi:hypothetical protein ACJIZ3_009503 [Penstemon smallii]|uniref:Uncharacterized protein n=1 Tax=Penstemon smallii TaxID=265156 RepID=A0ABD3TCP8_9LAMI
MLPVNSTIKEDLKVAVNQTIPANPAGWENHGWFYIAVRIALFLWVALLNLITISSTWARVIDVMDIRFKIVRVYWCWCYARTALWFTVRYRNGLVRSMYVSSLLPLSHLYLLLFAALLLEFAAQSSKGINKDTSQFPEELLPMRYYIFIICFMPYHIQGSFLLKYL